MREIGKQILKSKKVIIISILILILIVLSISLYISQKEVRDWVDIHILGKNLTEDDIESISLNTDKNNQIHVYSKYIAVLNDKAVTLYNSYGEKVTSIDVNINAAVFDSSDKYLAIAENNGHEVCLILDKTYLWSETIEGEILQVHVNKNGYVGVVTTDVTHKSILTVYNSGGKKLFTSYFASTRIIDVSISEDNKYIAIGDIDTSGTILKSAVKIISTKNAEEDPDNTIIYTYEAEDGILIANVKYQSKGQISCIYDNGIGIIKDESYNEILKIDSDNITYIANDLKNDIAYVVEESTGFFKATSNVHIVNTANSNENIYKLENVAKEVYAKDNIIAINVGTEIYFINTGGWLVKKYTANQEITNVKFSDSLAAIIYKDKIVIVSL